jgi:hypothetical protein
MDRSHAKHTRAHGDGKKRRASKTNGERQRRRAHPDRDMVPRDGRRKTPIRAPTTHLRVDTSDGTARTRTARRRVPAEQKGSQSLRRKWKTALQNQRPPGNSPPPRTTQRRQRNHHPVPDRGVCPDIRTPRRPATTLSRRHHRPHAQQTTRGNYGLRR